MARHRIALHELMQCGTHRVSFGGRVGRREVAVGAPSRRVFNTGPPDARYEFLCTNSYSLNPAGINQLDALAQNAP
jgi:hypothetical protein